MLFTVYLDELLHRLSSLGVGCHFGGQFVGGIAYADDVTLLAPSPSALRTLLKKAQLFAAESKLTFNATKTQLVCFPPHFGYFPFGWSPTAFL